MKKSIFSSGLFASIQKDRQRQNGPLTGTRWVALLLLLCLSAVSMKAQGRSTDSKISVAVADGVDGQQDAIDPGIFTIQCGAYNTEQPTEFHLTLNEPTAYPVSVELRMVSIGRYYQCSISIDDGDPILEHVIVTFEPGQTSKKVTFSPGITMEDFVSAPIVGRKPFYIELLYPSRATLDVRLIEFVYSFDGAPGEDATTNYSVETIDGNFALPLYSQDGYCFFYLQPQNGRKIVEFLFSI